MRYLLKRTMAGLLLAACLGIGWVNAADIDADYYQVDDNALLHFQNGQAWMSVQRYDAAIKEFQVGIKLKPSTTMTASLYNNMGMAYLALKSYDRAIISFQQAVELNPNFSLYYENLAKAYKQANSAKQAAQFLANTVKNNPDDLQAWYLLGVLYQQLGQWVKSQQAFESYVNLSPYSDLAMAAQEHMEQLAPYLPPPTQAGP